MDRESKLALGGSSVEVALMLVAVVVAVPLPVGTTAADTEGKYA